MCCYKSHFAIGYEQHPREIRHDYASACASVSAIVHVTGKICRLFVISTRLSSWTTSMPAALMVLAAARDQ